MMCDDEKLLNYMPLSRVTGEAPEPEQETRRSLPTCEGNN